MSLNEPAFKSGFAEKRFLWKLCSRELSLRVWKFWPSKNDAYVSIEVKARPFSARSTNCPKVHMENLTFEHNRQRSCLVFDNN